MMNMIEMQGRTVDEAINNALKELQVGRDQVSIEILDEGSRGFLGFGAKPAKVRAAVKEAVTYTAIKEELQTGKRPEKSEKKEKPAKTESEPRPLPNEQEVQRIVEAAQKALSVLLKHLQIEYTVEVKRHEDQIQLNIHCENENFLIGKRGTTLDAVQYLVNRIANKDASEKIQVVLDTSDYRMNRNLRIEKLAQRLSKRVKMTGKSVTIPPMNPHDRRIVHLALQDDQGITTLSRGTGFMRRIIISAKRSNSNRSRKSA